jgi:hypothetical protein
MDGDVGVRPMSPQHTGAAFAILSPVVKGWDDRQHEMAMRKNAVDVLASEAPLNERIAVNSRMP